MFLQYLLMASVKCLHYNGAERNCTVYLKRSLIFNIFITNYPSWVTYCMCIQVAINY